MGDGGGVVIWAGVARGATLICIPRRARRRRRWRVSGWAWAVVELVRGRALAGVSLCPQGGRGVAGGDLVLSDGSRGVAQGCGGVEEGGVRGCSLGRCNRHGFGGLTQEVAEGVRAGRWRQRQPVRVGRCWHRRKRRAQRPGEGADEPHPNRERFGLPADGAPFPWEARRVPGSRLTPSGGTGDGLGGRRTVPTASGARRASSRGGKGVKSPEATPYVQRGCDTCFMCDRDEGPLPGPRVRTALSALEFADGLRAAAIARTELKIRSQSEHAVSLTVSSDVAS